MVTMIMWDRLLPTSLEDVYQQTDILDHHQNSEAAIHSHEFSLKPCTNIPPN